MACNASFVMSARTTFSSISDQYVKSPSGVARLPACPKKTSPDWARIFSIESALPKAGVTQSCGVLLA
jgi:hypothetical protein